LAWGPLDGAHLLFHPLASESAWESLVLAAYFGCVSTRNTVEYSVAVILHQGLHQCESFHLFMFGS
jgi:hypothetical protein